MICFYNLIIPTSCGDGYQCAIKPVIKFESGCSKNCVKVKLRMTNNEIARINGYIEDLNVNIANTQNLINFYSANNTKVLDFAENFDYNYYKEILNNIIDLLEKRSVLYEDIEVLYQNLIYINAYCIEDDISASDFDRNYYTRCFTLLKSNQ